MASSSTCSAALPPKDSVKQQDTSSDILDKDISMDPALTALTSPLPSTSSSGERRHSAKDLLSEETIRDQPLEIPSTSVSPPLMPCSSASNSIVSTTIQSSTTRSDEKFIVRDNDAIQLATADSLSQHQTAHQSSCSSNCNQPTPSPTVTKTVICMPSDIAESVNNELCRPILDSYPFRQFGKNKRRFQSQFYSNFPWLEYSILNDAVYCFACRFFGRETGPFAVKGFCDWQHATGDGYGLTAHNTASTHRLAVLAWEEHKVRLENSCTVTQLMNKAHAQMKKANIMYIKTLAEIILFCGRQEIALRGDDETEHSLNRGNFLELVDVIAKHDSQFAEKLAQVGGNATYLSPQIQNEIVVAIGDVILDKICSLVSKSGCFALMADETKDASKIEQISVILRFVNTESNSWSVEERFLGFIPATCCDAASLTKYLVDTINKRELLMKHCIAQAYDGASVMSGSCSGVQARIKEYAPMAVYIHCMAHRLNLVLVDVCKKVLVASEFFDQLQAVYIFMSSGTSHPLLIETQRKLYPNRSPLELKRLIETR